MSKGALAFIVNCMTDSEIEGRYNVATSEDLKQAHEQARCDYEKWLETITEYKAHEAASDVVENVARTESLCAYSEGFKAGIKLIFDALS